MKVRALRGRHINRIGTIVNYEDTPHGRLHVVLFDGDDFELYLERRLKLLAKMLVGFVGGDTRLDKFIEGFSRGTDVDISHAFLMLFGSTYESTGAKEPEDPYPGVWLHSPNKFRGDPHARFVVVDVPDRRAGEDKARALLGTLYGYTDCVETGLQEIFGVSIPDNALTMHCSETVTRVLRATGLDVLPELEAGSVSPAHLYRTIMEDHNGREITI